MHVRFIGGTLILILMFAGGCSTPALTARPSYPATAVRKGVLDIQIQFHGREISLTNTTASRLSAGRLWINAWYSVATPDLAVGQTIGYTLTAFHDEHGEIIRGGGFFASEAPEEILFAELETSGSLYGLVVVLNETGH